jgi:Fur family ferric uptake transcriptional regulator
MLEPLRMTPQRRAILEELRHFERHPTAREVYGQVRQRLPRISLGTVYRNLELLSRRGMIRRFAVGSGERRYDGDMNDHYHLCCVRCGRIEDAPMAPLAHLEEMLGDANGYDVIGHRIEFSGVCPRCKAASSDRTGGTDRSTRKA